MASKRTISKEEELQTLIYLLQKKAGTFNEGLNLEEPTKVKEKATKKTRKKKELSKRELLKTHNRIIEELMKESLNEGEMYPTVEEIVEEKLGELRAEISKMGNLADFIIEQGKLAKLHGNPDSLLARLADRLELAERAQNEFKKMKIPQKTAKKLAGYFVNLHYATKNLKKEQLSEIFGKKHVSGYNLRKGEKERMRLIRDFLVMHKNNPEKIKTVFEKVRKVQKRKRK